MLTFLHRHRNPLALTGAAASWGLATVIAKNALSELEPLALFPVQLAVSVALLGILLLPQRDRLAWPPELRKLGLLGILNPGIAYALGLLGLTYITASLYVVLWAIEPMMILLLAWWVLGDRITKPVTLAAVTTLAGVLLIVFEPGAHGQPIGIALTLLGVAACAIYTVVSRKWMASESTVQLIALQQAVALLFALLLLAAAAIAGRTTPLTDISMTAWLSAIASGALYYAAAFWLFLTGLRHVPAAIAGLYINLIPVFGIAASYALLGERLTARQWLGAILIVTTMFVIAGASARPASTIEAVAQPR